MTSSRQNADLGPGAQSPDGYLTGVHHGWHAVTRAALPLAATTGDGIRIVLAACGTFVTLAPMYGTYARDAVPVAYEPCPECAWAVAVATSTADREIQLITPDEREAAALAALGLDPFLPGALCRAILAAAEDEPGREVIRQLAAVTRHRPGLAVSAGCAEGDCEDTSAAGTCGCPARAVCWGCSLRAGTEAGEWAGSLMGEGIVDAPCSVLAALAAGYGLEIAARR